MLRPEGAANQMSKWFVVPLVSGQLALVTVQVLPTAGSSHSVSTVPLEFEIFAFVTPVVPPASAVTLISTLSKAESATFAPLAL